MTLPKRYALITIGILFFFIAAPSLVLGIRGYTFDFQDKRLIKTGILEVKIEPRDVEITVENQGKTRVRNKSGSFRFLKPGDYKVTIEKSGYFTWQKNLAVRGGLVTRASGDTQSVVLIPEKPKLISESANYEPKNKSSESQYIYSFEKLGDNGANLVRLNTKNTQDKKIILANLPYREKSQIYAAPNGLIFVIIDRVLYQVGNDLAYLADGVDFARWDKNAEKLAYGNAHELNLYDPFNPAQNQRELIIRTSEEGGNFCIMPKAGYVLRVYGNFIRAIELDGRDRRNTYYLLSSENNLDIIECDSLGESIVVRDKDKYKIYSLN